ncbi:MAG: Alcohol dehydrogenase zinc-binding domain protein [Bryobacterales bacterium]|nr:Alcohol dehydrogenase zinc-binding domain protein [Bryobacterales bacterium]
MRAVRIHSFGGPEVLRIDEAERPEPKAGELLVRVAAAAVNPVDWMVRAGLMQWLLNNTLPLTLGCDVAGSVEQLGPGVEGFREGDSVYAFIHLTRLGAFAEFATVKAEEASRKPETLDVVHAASVPVAVLTAWQAIFDAAGLESGQTILIHGAAGGIGSMAVQLAKWKGARVIGTASEKNHEYLIALGADEVVDYRKTPFETAVRNVDVVLDTLGGETQEKSFQVLKPGGFLVSLVSPPPQDKGVRAAMINVQTNGKRLEEAAKLIDDGVLKTLVETVLPLEEASKAIALSQSGRTRGKIVLRVN